MTKKKKTTEADKGFLSRLGPGLITGASDDDPSGIGTYSQARAQLGFGIGWTMLLTYPLMAAIQEISARIGRVTGHGIAGNVCRNFPAPVVWLLVFLLFIANTINVAADLGAMADSVNLLVGGPRVFYVVAFGCVSVMAQIFLEYKRYVAILMVDARPVRLCHHASGREGAMGRSASRLVGAPGPVGRRVPDNAGCNFRNDDIAVSLHLAIIPGGGRAADRAGEKATY